MAGHSTLKYRMPASRLSRVLALLVASLLLSACVDVEIRSEYRLDGTAAHSIEITIPEQPGEEISPEQVDAVLENLRQRATDAGLQFVRTERRDTTSVRITGTTGDSLDAGASINGLINATGLNASPGVTAPFRGTFARETGAVGGTAYTLDLTVDGQLLFDSVAVSSREDRETALRNGLTVHYVATLPGDITETTGERVDDHTVRWEVQPAGETALTATSRTGGSGSAALFIILGLAAFGVVIVVALVLGWYFAGRERLANTLGGALHRLPGQRTITTEGAWVAAKISGLTHRLSKTRRDDPEERG